MNQLTRPPRPDGYPLLTHKQYSESGAMTAGALPFGQAREAAAEAEGNVCVEMEAAALYDGVATLAHVGFARGISPDR